MLKLKAKVKEQVLESQRKQNETWKWKMNNDKLCMSYCSFIFHFFNYASGRASPASIKKWKILANKNPCGKGTDETDVAWFFLCPQCPPIHNHNRCFPLGRILLLKPTKEEPKHNDAKTLSLFLYVLQLVSCRPKPRFIFISRKIRTKTERASYQAIDRPSDRSIERFSDFFFQTVFSSGNTFGPPL